MKKWIDGIYALTELALIVAFVLTGVTWVNTGHGFAWAIFAGLAALGGAIFLASKGDGRNARN